MPGSVTGAVTAIVPESLRPSLVAMIVALPAATPVTNPVALTAATAGLLVAHVTVRPVSVSPAVFVRVVVNDRADPTATLALAGETVTVATGAGLTAVLPLATLESAPNTVLGVSSNPRNATSWN